MSRRKDKPKQLGLFGEPDEPDKPVVGAAPAAEALLHAAAALPPQLRMGTSSWSFPGWKDLVYDRTAKQSDLARHGLEAYARHPLLRSVGIDRTFYAPISAEAFADYAEAVPDDFRFLVKASSECTTPWRRDDEGNSRDNPRYLDPVFAKHEVVAPFVEGLGAKAGPLVFQFPPQGFRRDEAETFAGALGRFLGALPPGPRYAVELRDKSLLTAAYADVLRDHNATHCISLHPRMPALAQQAELARGVGGPLVVRWMLRRGLAYEAARKRYAPFSDIVDEDPENREGLAELVLESAQRGEDAYVIANNKAEGCAPQSVFKLAEVIARRNSGQAGER